MYTIKESGLKPITNVYVIKDAVVKSVTNIYSIVAGRAVLVWTAIKDAISGIIGSGIWNNDEMWNNEDIWKNEP